MAETATLAAPDASGFQCECVLHGFCNRHGVEKTPREVRICNGTSGLDEPQRQKYLRQWGEKPPGQGKVRIGPATPRQRRRRRRRAGHFSRQCVHLDRHIMEAPCKCGGRRKISLFACNHSKQKKFCTPFARDYAQFKEPDLQAQTVSCEGCPYDTMTPRFVSTADLMKDAKKLAQRLPPDTEAIAGVARSGLCAATMVAMMMHKPIYIVRQSKLLSKHGQCDIIEGGSGWRIWQGASDKPKKIVVVDDTVMTGNSLRAIREAVHAKFGAEQVKTASVYVNPFATDRPDYHAADLPWPHILEWNLFNSVLVPSCAFDFDGILCDDCPPQDDDDGARYLKFLRNVRPKYPVRREPIPLIVTARLEKYRSETMAWLDKWGMRVNRLVMGPWKNNAERARDNVAKYKAKHFAQFLADGGPGVRPKLFIESEEWQAKAIAKKSGGFTVCPAAGRCFGE